MSATTTPLPIVATDGGVPGNDSRLPPVVWVERPGAALRPTPQAGDDVLGLNLTRGCVHRCGFCSVRAAPSYPGDDFVYLYADTAEQLATELAARHRRPRAVLLCPAADPFPPVVEVQAEAGRAVEVIAKHGVEAWLMTRGLIRPAVRELLAVYRRHVRVTVPFVTVRRDWQRLLEPWAAPPRLRLRQLSTLRELGIAAQVTLEPLLPELTDTPENLDSLLRALAAAGVRHVTAGYAFVREGIAENLRKDLDRHGWAEPVLAAYEGGPVLTAAGLAPARYLPRPRRQRGYAALMALAATHGISVSVSRLTNPDFAVPSDPGPPRPRQRLLSLFLQSAGRDEPSPEAAGRD